MALKSLPSWSVAPPSVNDTLPITVTPSLARTDTTETSVTFAEPWPLLTVTWAWQVAPLSFWVPRSTLFGSLNLPFERR